VLTPWLEDADVTLYHGDVLAVLRELPAESVDCCVTSPPYWGLRDYGTGAWEGGDEECDHAQRYRGQTGLTKPDPRWNTGGPASLESHVDAYRHTCGKCGATRTDQQLGLEPTPEEYVTRMVEVFREVRRVLAAHGTVWINLGDSYASDPGKGGSGTPNGRNNRGEKYPRPGFGGLKQKDLVGIPWRVAFALQADGWYLRSDIIWAKPNPMPESVTDRPTKAHEYVFLLSKQPRYYWDAEAVREKFEARPQQRLTDVRDQPLAEARRAAGVEQGNPQGGAHVSRFRVQEDTLEWCGCVEAGCGRSFDVEDCGCACHTPEPVRGPDGRLKTTVQAANGSIQHRDGERWPNGGRNIRSVWEIPTQPYPEAHFATFPEELARRCIAAGTSERGRCPECGEPWVREVVRTGETNDRDRSNAVDYFPEKGGNPSGIRTLSGATYKPQRAATNDWVPRCQCRVVKEGDLIGRIGLASFIDPIPCVVLDPFAGSGTVAHVARKLGRHAIGIDLNESYLELAARRLQQQSLFAGTA
jgi:site-specific DNA-methyltransferase (cytosine-N4-specific)